MVNYCDFVHLHCHSDFSLYDGFQTVESMVEKARSLNFRAIALTDHGKLSGFIRFFKACKKKFKEVKKDGEKIKISLPPIKPIFGLEAYIVEDISKRKIRFHQTILAKDRQGYENLLSLSSDSHDYLYRNFPCLDFKMLKKKHEGLIVTSGCTASQFSKLCIEGKIEEAYNLAKEYKDIWDKDYYIEVMLTGYKPQIEVLKQAVPISKKLGIKIIATNDVHYNCQKDSKYQLVKKSISRNGPLPPNEGREKSYYIKSYEEMSKIFRGEMGKFLKNTLEVEEKCFVELELGKAQLPIFEIPKNDNEFIKFRKKLCKRGDEEAYLKYLSEKGLKEKGLWEKPVYRRRLIKELETIRFTGFVRYFLIVWEYCNWARKNDIKIGVGRGSGVGSLVLYCLGITGLDPIKYGLTMDRFLYAAADYRARESDFFE